MLRLLRDNILSLVRRCPLVLVPAKRFLFFSTIISLACYLIVVLLAIPSWFVFRLFCLILGFFPLEAAFVLNTCSEVSFVGTIFNVFTYLFVAVPACQLLALRYFAWQKLDHTFFVALKTVNPSVAAWLRGLPPVSIFVSIRHSIKRIALLALLYPFYLLLAALPFVGLIVAPASSYIALRNRLGTRIAILVASILLLSAIASSFPLATTTTSSWLSFFSDPSAILHSVVDSVVRTVKLLLAAYLAATHCLRELLEPLLARDRQSRRLFWRAVRDRTDTSGIAFAAVAAVFSGLPFVGPAAFVAAQALVAVVALRFIPELPVGRDDNDGSHHIEYSRGPTVRDGTFAMEIERHGMPMVRDDTAKMAAVPLKAPD